MVNQQSLTDVTHCSEKDISDPDEVKEFAEKVGDMEHLDYLYTLRLQISMRQIQNFGIHGALH
jgi:hypothetical protein